MQLILFGFAVYCASACYAMVPQAMQSHPTNKNAGVYKPNDHAIDRSIKGSGAWLFISGSRQPMFYGEIIIPVLATGSRVGKVVIQKGAMNCIFTYFCVNGLTLNQKRELQTGEIATVDYRIISYGYVYSRLDILVGYRERGESTKGDTPK